MPMLLIPVASTLYTTVSASNSGLRVPALTKRISGSAGAAVVHV